MKERTYILKGMYSKTCSLISPPPEYSEKTILYLDDTNRGIKIYLELTPVVSPTGIDQENHSNTENNLNLSCFPCVSQPYTTLVI